MLVIELKAIAKLQNIQIILFILNLLMLYFFSNTQVLRYETINFVEKGVFNEEDTQNNILSMHLGEKVKHI